jgi:hypothetical protein
MNRISLTTGCIFFLLLGSLHADTTDVHQAPIGYGWMEGGQIGLGYYKRPSVTPEQISHVWQQRAGGWFGYDIAIQEKLKIQIAAGGFIANSTPQLGTDPQTLQARNFFFLKRAYASYLFGDPENISANLQFGFYPYKYNPDVRNLGENLFRTHAYPTLVYSEFDYPLVDLLGARFHFNYQTPATEDGANFKLQNDLLLHSEIYSIPVQDWSLSDIVSARIANTLSVGAGISFCNLFSVYHGRYGSSWMDQYFEPKNLPPDKQSAFYLKDSTGADSALFNWKATKLMGRLAFDPKKLLSNVSFIPIEIFGPNDLTLYGEADFIGLKNYPSIYTKLMERTFLSVGFNVPTFKLLDVLSGELEFCADTSAFSEEGFYGPTPDYNPSYLVNSASRLPVKRDPLRWSIYAKKTILNGHIGFVAQVARDHKKINFYYFKREYMSFIETLPESNNWWWIFKTEFSF